MDERKLERAEALIAKAKKLLEEGKRINEELAQLEK